MDRNTIIGFSLIFLILVGYWWFTSPGEAQQALEKRQQDSLARIEAASKANSARIKAADTIAKVSKDTIADKSGLKGFAAQLGGQAQTVVLSNKTVTVNLTTLGASVESVVLNTHKNADGGALTLIPARSAEFYYEINMPNQVLRTDRFNWKVAAQSSTAVTFRLENGTGGYIDQIYTLNAQDYLVDYKLVLHGIQDDIVKGNRDLRLTWVNTPVRQEKNMKPELENSTVVYKMPGDDPERLSAASPEKQNLKNKLNWVAFKQQYFSSILMSKEDIDKEAELAWEEVQGKDQIKKMRASLWLKYDQEVDKSYSLSFYFGPNEYNRLKNLSTGIEDAKLQDIIPKGWGIFGWVNQVLVIPVFTFLSSKVASMGLVILLLTLIIKLILLPLVYKSYISTAKMRILKPEMEAIKEKTGGDLQKTQLENAALYKKAGVSPLSGCVPMLLQMPILFAMFQFFPYAFELRQKAFLWSQDLSRYDSVLDFGFHIPGYGDHLSLFTLLMTISTIIYTRLNNQISGVTGQMKWIGYFMPVIFMGVLNDYACGLTWYYFVSNMVTFAQQFIIRRFVDDNKLHAQIAENRKKPVKKSAFQARMEAAMKQAQNRKQMPPKGKK
ncbi:MAG: membrane protein insertase YidC [Bacteroidetes bacterium]|nr:membrane protein insertase YidC [Bacteroidota bacterium]